MTAKNFNDAWPSRYLTAADIEGKPPFKATINRIEWEKMQDGSEKPVAYFAKMKKGVVLNKTKGKFLAGLAKSMKFDDWIGLDVQIRAGVTQFKSDEVACIKFERTAAAKKVQVAEEINDEIPDFNGEEPQEAGEYA
jgi:hypothetical protein